jgi:hypothetical protein
MVFNFIIYWIGDKMKIKEIFNAFNNFMAKKVFFMEE